MARGAGVAYDHVRAGADVDVGRRAGAAYDHVCAAAVERDVPYQSAARDDGAGALTAHDHVAHVAGVADDHPRTGADVDVGRRAAGEITSVIGEDAAVFEPGFAFEDDVVHLAVVLGVRRCEAVHVQSGVGGEGRARHIVGHGPQPDLTAVRDRTAEDPTALVERSGRVVAAAVDVYIGTRTDGHFPDRAPGHGERGVLDGAAGDPRRRIAVEHGYTGAGGAVDVDVVKLDAVCRNYRTARDREPADRGVAVQHELGVGGVAAHDEIVVRAALGGVHGAAGTDGDVVEGPAARGAVHPQVRIFVDVAVVGDGRIGQRRLGGYRGSRSGAVTVSVLGSHLSLSLSWCWIFIWKQNLS